MTEPESEPESAGKAIEGSDESETEPEELSASGDKDSDREDASESEADEETKVNISPFDLTIQCVHAIVYVYYI